ncbi:MAG: hypothetical protein C4308_06460 [Chitinophagaceae bacterium]
MLADYTSIYLTVWKKREDGRYNNQQYFYEVIPEKYKCLAKLILATFEKTFQKNFLILPFEVLQSKVPGVTTKNSSPEGSTIFELLFTDHII